MAMLTSILTIYGAVCGILTAVSMALHALGLSEKKYAKLFITVSNDVVEFYKVLSGSKNAAK